MFVNIYIFYAEDYDFDGAMPKQEYSLQQAYHPS